MAEKLCELKKKGGGSNQMVELIINTSTATGTTTTAYIGNTLTFNNVSSYSVDEYTHTGGAYINVSLDSNTNILTIIMQYSKASVAYAKISISS